jgi:hypothetical protein
MAQSTQSPSRRTCEWWVLNVVFVANTLVHAAGSQSRKTRFATQDYLTNAFLVRRCLTIRPLSALLRFVACTVKLSRAVGA